MGGLSVTHFFLAVVMVLTIKNFGWPSQLTNTLIADIYSIISNSRPSDLYVSKAHLTLA